MIILTKTATNLINPDNAVFLVNTNLHNEASSNELNLSRVVRQITIPADMQVAVLVSYHNSGLMTTETNGNVVECQYSIIS